jgi:hypothetical protein
MQLVARQNFRFSPRSYLVPAGSFCFVHRLWKVRFFGCACNSKGSSVMCLLKFCCRDFVGFAQKP